jgi:hypothetical protein
MTRANVLQEVRQMRFEELYARRQQRELTMAEAGEMIGVTERTFRRWSTCSETAGRRYCRIGGSTHEWVSGCQWDRVVTL